jgi:hypothetical protein
MSMQMIQTANAPRDNPEFCAFASKTFGWRIRDFAGNHGQVELVYRTWLAVKQEAGAGAAEQPVGEPSAISEAQELEDQQNWWANYLANNELASKNPSLASRDAWLQRARISHAANSSLAA